MYRKTLLFTASILTPTAGCLHVEGEQPLTAEHAQLLAKLLDQEPAATEMAVVLARKMDSGMVDGYGDSASHETLALSIRSTSDWLHTQYESERIMEVDPKKFSTADTTGFYDTESTQTHTDDRLVLSSDTSTWNLPEIIHEAGHKTFSHDVFVTQAIRDAGGELNRGYSQVVKDYRDYAYLLTALYAVPASLIEQTREDLAALTSGESLSHQEVMERLEISSSEEAQEALEERYAHLEPMFAEFGISMDELAQAYSESGMHEALQEWREEAVREYQEHREMRLEMERGEKRM